MLLVRNYYKKFFTSVNTKSQKMAKHALHWVDGRVITAKGKDLLDTRLRAEVFCRMDFSDPSVPTPMSWSMVLGARPMPTSAAGRVAASRGAARRPRMDSGSGALGDSVVES